MSTLPPQPPGDQPPVEPPERPPLSPRRPRAADSETPELMRQLGLAMGIPMLMLAGPLTGFCMAWAMRRWLGWPEWVTYVMVLLGFVAGIRETIRVIQRISK